MKLRFLTADARRHAALHGEFSTWAVLTEDLRPESVPETTADWAAVYHFALSYDGYALWKDVGSYANRVSRNWVRSGGLPQDLDNLRACLFFEQRRFHHFGWDPSGDQAEYIGSLLSTIRARISETMIMREPFAGDDGA